MTCRPQFACYPVPAGMEDEQFHYSFDGTNTPSLSSALPVAPHVSVNNIILPLEADALFICRALKIELGVSSSGLYLQLRTPGGDFISSPYVPIYLLATGTGVQPAGFLFVPLEPEIECPAGSNWTLDLFNNTLASLNPPAVTLFGVKRRVCIGKRRAA